MDGGRMEQLCVSASRLAAARRRTFQPIFLSASAVEANEVRLGATETKGNKVELT